MSHKSPPTLLGWIIKGEHLDSGIMAYNTFWAINNHDLGTFELFVWADVEAGSASYEITKEDRYSVELKTDLLDGENNLLYGEAFQTKNEADEMALRILSNINLIYSIIKNDTRTIKADG